MDIDPPPDPPDEGHSAAPSGSPAQQSMGAPPAAGDIQQGMLALLGNIHAALLVMQGQHAAAPAVAPAVSKSLAPSPAHSHIELSHDVTVPAHPGADWPRATFSNAVATRLRLDKFDGLVNPEMFLENYERYHERQGTSASLLSDLPFFLEKEPAKWLYSTSKAFPADAQSWEWVRAQFIAHFSTQVRSEAELARDKLFAGKLTMGTSLPNYIRDFCHVARIAIDMNVKDQCRFFLQGLPNALRVKCLCTPDGHDWIDLLALTTHALHEQRKYEFSKQNRIDLRVPSASSLSPTANKKRSFPFAAQPKATTPKLAAATPTAVSDDGFQLVRPAKRAAPSQQPRAQTSYKELAKTKQRTWARWSDNPCHVSKLVLPSNQPLTEDQKAILSLDSICFHCRASQHASATCAANPRKRAG